MPAPKALHLGALSSDQFVTGEAALDADDRIVYNPVTGEIFYDAHGSGLNGSATLFATVAPLTSLSAADFTIFG